MHQSIVEAKIGKAVVLELVNGLQLLTQIKSVDPYTAYCDKAFMFAMTETGPTVIPYGRHGCPVIKPNDENPFDLRHIVQVYDADTTGEKVWLQATSGIQLAGADALRGLKSANESR
jgi:hypothetical protein